MYKLKLFAAVAIFFDGFLAFRCLANFWSFLSPLFQKGTRGQPGLFRRYSPTRQWPTSILTNTKYNDAEPLSATFFSGSSTKMGKWCESRSAHEAGSPGRLGGGVELFHLVRSQPARDSREPDSDGSSNIIPEVRWFGPLTFFERD